ncbi:MAG: phenylalanine--tRNA ligase subunit alpha [Spirochaetes bacterium GWC1_27_15]|nr:MAG: phenylalanine--tRNA ligase subunit alpha [Spirochaetes bacterium GWB1_27_13]OHD25317.1 MAG: phenylalanine--tRNA ligase subunit alpha [Spirochaetes bacterium GWC1_27_15]
MLDKLNEIKEIALNQIKAAKDSKTLEEIKIKFLGKKGEITSLLKLLGSLSAEEKPKFGALVNDVRNFIETELDKFFAEIKNRELNEKFLQEKVDITLPGRPQKIGVRHPIRIVLDQIEEIFIGMGFDIEEGPEIDTDFNNFKAMNFQDDHPARDSQDTFYINESVLFRTHTSPIQARTMQKMAPNPVRVICPGRAFRRDDIDATHSVQFHQVEGLLIDKNVKFSDLIGILQLFAQKMFGEHMKIRLRPSFFPFTEPSAEVDVSCIFCGGKGCSFCKHSGWLEILGAGAVHPNVLKTGGYDPEIYSGWAFGMGAERIALLKYQINDIRLTFENDVRFLKQFR